MRANPPHQTRIHVSLSLSTIESLFDLVKYGIWSGEAIPGVRRPMTILVRTAYSITATRFKIDEEPAMCYVATA